MIRLSKVCAMSHIKKYSAKLGRVWSNDSEVNILPKSEKRREQKHDDKVGNI